MTNVAIVFAIIAVVCIVAYYAIFWVLALIGLVPLEWLESDILSPYRGRVSLFNWIMLGDYEQGKLRSTELAVRRFSRGNISLQNKHFMNKFDLRNLSTASDSTLRQIERSGQAP